MVVVCAYHAFDGECCRRSARDARARKMPFDRDAAGAPMRERARLFDILY